MKISLTLCLLLSIAAAAPDKWVRVGEAGQVKIEPNLITLSTSQDAIAGALSAAGEARGDAIVVEAKIADAPARGVTFAYHETANGESIGYWQNPLAIAGENQIDAILPLERRTKSGRLFVGSDRAASQARIADVTYRATTRRASSVASAYGSLVDSSHTPGQTFTSSGSKLDAILFRARLLHNVDGPDLIVRLFAWDAKTGKVHPALEERRIPRSQFPKLSDGFEVDFPVAFHAKLKRGSEYLIEWTAAGECSAEQAYLLYAGDDSYPKGSRYENGNASNWDMYFETYESD